jgi:hypothetical protein
MLSKKDIYHSLFAFSVLALASYVGNTFKQKFSERTDDEYDIIRTYLLNESPLYGMNKPKLWIHSKYEVNARDWKNGGRNTTQLSQPYLHLTIQSIIDHGGDDFHICLIDDHSFSKLIPAWAANVATLAEPMRSQFREYGLMTLVFLYGGMLVPNSFVCTRNLKSLYDDGLRQGRPFVCEAINRTTNMVEQKHRLLFIPDLYFMGAKRDDDVMRELVEWLKTKCAGTHFSDQRRFLGESNHWSMKRMTVLGGEKIGIKTTKRQQILLEDLVSDGFLDIPTDSYGVYIPGDEVLLRPNYKWLAYVSKGELLASDIAIAKYLKTSMIDANDDYYKSNVIRSATGL